MKRLEKELTKNFYEATEGKDITEVHRQYVKFRKYVLDNEHDNANFTKINTAYVNYINSTNLKITLNLEYEDSVMIWDKKREYKFDYTARYHW